MRFQYPELNGFQDICNFDFSQVKLEKEFEFDGKTFRTLADLRNADFRRLLKKQELEMEAQLAEDVLHDMVDNIGQMSKAQIKYAIELAVQLALFAGDEGYFDLCC